MYAYIYNKKDIAAERLSDSYYINDILNNEICIELITNFIISRPFLKWFDDYFTNPDIIL